MYWGWACGLIGVPYAVLWGCLAALMRFIPYVGPGAAFILPLVFSFAYFPGWLEPLLVVALFAVVEASQQLPGADHLRQDDRDLGARPAGGRDVLDLALGDARPAALDAADGLPGGAGQVRPGLRFFATMLGEEADLEPDVRFYQRLVALDREGAVAVVDAALKKRPRAEVFDRVLVPTLSRAERDAARDDLGDAEQAFIWQVIGEIVEELEKMPELDPGPAASPAAGPTTGDGAGRAGPAPVAIMGVAVDDTSDVLVLRMLGQLLAPSGCHLEIVRDTESPLQVVEQVAERIPEARRPVARTARRADARPLPGQPAPGPVLRPADRGRPLGRDRGRGRGAERLTNVGATHVVFTLADARDRILKTVLPQPEPGTVGFTTVSSK